MTWGLGVGWQERDWEGMVRGRGVAFSDATDWRCAAPPPDPSRACCLRRIFVRVSGPSTPGCLGMTFKQRLIWRGIENR